MGGLSHAIMLTALLQSSFWAASHAVTYRSTSGYDEYLYPILIPEPRRNGTVGERWMKLHEKYLSENEAYQQDGMNLLVYGDSLTESFRGAIVGRKAAQFKDNRRAWDQLIRKKYRAAPYSISGDRATQLLWRLKNGEGPYKTKVQVILLLIGTNDIGLRIEQWPGQLDMAARAVFLGIRLAVEEIVVQAPRAKVVLMSLPPCEPPWATDSRYQWVVDTVNQQMQEYSQERDPPMVQFFDCGSRFIDERNTMAGVSRAVNRKLVPDGIHPTGPEGAVALANCVLEAAEQFMPTPA